MATIGELQAKLELDTKGFDSKLTQAERSVGSFGGSLARVGEIATGIIVSRVFEKIADTIINVGTTGLNVSRQMETASKGFEGMGISAEETAKILERIKKEAKATPFEITGLTQSTQLLTSVTKDGNKSIDIILSLGKALANAGKGQAELDRVAINLQQIASLGKAATIDIKQFAFAGIPIYEMLTEATGKAGEELQKFIEDGGVTFDFLIEMFKKAGDEGGRFAKAFEAQNGTIAQLESNLKDTFDITSQGFFEQTGLADAYKNSLKNLTDFIPKLSEKAMELFTELKPVVEAGLSVVSKFAGGLFDLGKILFDVATTSTYAQENMEGLQKAFGLTENQANFLGNQLYGMKEAFDGVAQKMAPIGKALREGFGDFVARIGPKLQEFAQKLQPLIEKLTERFGKFANEMAERLAPILKFIAENIFPVLGDIIENVILPALGWLFEAFVNIATVIMDVVVKAFDFIKPIIETFVAVIQEVARVVSGVFNDLIIPLFQLLQKVVEIVFNTIGSVIAAVWEKLQPIMQPLIDWIDQNVVPILKGFQKVFEDVFTGIKIGVENAWNGLGDVIKGGINYIIDEINRFIRNVNDALAKIDKFGETLGINVNFRVGEIPRLAKGTNFFDGGMALVGEQGPELVQMPKGAKVSGAAETRNMSGSVTNIFNINGAGMDVKALVNEIKKQLARDNQSAARGQNPSYY